MAIGDATVKINPKIYEDLAAEAKAKRMVLKWHIEDILRRYIKRRKKAAK